MGAGAQLSDGLGQIVGHTVPCVFQKFHFSYLRNAAYRFKIAGGFDTAFTFAGDFPLAPRILLPPRANVKANSADFFDSFDWLN